MDKPTTAELITMLREFNCHTDIQELAADRLEAAAPPKWTKITDGCTCPPLGDAVSLSVVSKYNVPQPPTHVHWRKFNQENYRDWLGAYWRPLNDNDYPPEQQ